MSEINTNLLVLVFCAQWCGVCRDFKVELENLAKKNLQHEFAWLDVETSLEWEDEFEIDNFPTVLIANQNNQVLFLGTIEPNMRALKKLMRVFSH